MSTRREFIQTSASVAFASMFFPINFKATDKLLPGLQLWTVKENLEKDFDSTLEKIAAIGYKHLECYPWTKGHYLGMKASVFKEKLNQHGLKLSGTHIGTGKHTKEEFPCNFATLSNGMEELINDALITGQEFITCAYLFESERKNLDQYKYLAQLLNKAGEACAKANLKLTYHNHAFEFNKLDQRVPYDVLLQGTDPKFVNFELDLYWVVKAGYDPIEYFLQYPGRFPQVHMKDMAKYGDKLSTEVGMGSIDFKRITEYAIVAGLKYYYVEQEDFEKAPLDSIKSSLNYLQNLGIG